MHVAIGSLFAEIKLKLINQPTHLFIETKKIFVSFLYTKDFVSYEHLFMIY